VHLRKKQYETGKFWPKKISVNLKLNLFYLYIHEISFLFITSLLLIWTFRTKGARRFWYTKQLKSHIRSQLYPKVKINVLTHNRLADHKKITSVCIILNWWKGKPSGSIVCTRKQQPRFYWSCSSVVMYDATPLTPLAHAQNSIFKCKQQTCTLHDPWGPEKIWLHNDVVRGDFLQPPHRH